MNTIHKRTMGLMLDTPADGAMLNSLQCSISLQNDVKESTIFPLTLFLYK